ncbi:MAG: hypothetical protein IJT96_02475 [Lachnospiraceae bacterium]|nr:hypothetical protein [Lachnospiraceae bacterium]
MISANFTTELKKLIEGDKQVASKPLVVGKPSQILTECGANAEQDITITKRLSIRQCGLRLEMKKAGWLEIPGMD